MAELSIFVLSRSRRRFRLHHHPRVSFASVTEIERRGSAQIAGITAMDVHVLPLVVALMPNARLFWLVSVSMTLSGIETFVIDLMDTSGQFNSLINVLRQTNIGNAGRVIAQQMDMWVEDGRVNGFTVLAEH